MRIILYTGKGGVGKTSIAAATAARLASEGRRVLIASTDQAHSLGDSLCMRLGGEPTTVAPNLDAMEIDVVGESEAAWGHFRGYLKELLTSRAAGGLEADELLILPGLEELFSLFRLLDIEEGNQYDVAIIDCAPTGETMSLLKFPELFGSMFEKIMPMKRKAARMAGPIVQTALKIPMPKDDVFADIERLMDQLARLQALMQNKDAVSIRIVTTPEKIVIRETKRNFTWLSLYDYNVDAVIVNRIYPKEALDGYFHRWAALQETGLAELRDSFRDIPLFPLALQKQELKSLPMLLSVSGLYGDRDPAEVLARNRIFRIRQEEAGPVLEISLPYADKREMALGQKDGEIHLTIGSEKRCFLLPDALQGREVRSARLERGLFEITFERAISRQ